MTLDITQHDLYLKSGKPMFFQKKKRKKCGENVVVFFTF